MFWCSWCILILFTGNKQSGAFRHIARDAQSKKKITTLLSLYDCAILSKAQWSREKIALNTEGKELTLKCV
jgi:hypothetical protein